MSQKNSRLGAIGEHMAAAQLMLQGWDAFNANTSITNMCSIDLICLNEQKQTALIQVKTTVESSFPTGLTMEQAKNRAEIEKHVAGPWIFVKKKGDKSAAQFKYYILSREDAIELSFQSNDWYLHKVDRGQKSVNEKSVCAIQEEWLNGKDYKAPRLNAETFVTPLKKSAQDDWNSIWL